eukprot:5924876-Prymnesium_polylepis.1
MPLAGRATAPGELTSMPVLLEARRTGRVGALSSSMVATVARTAVRSGPLGTNGGAAAAEEEELRLATSKAHARRPASNARVRSSSASRSNAPTVRVLASARAVTSRSWLRSAATSSREASRATSSSSSRSACAFGTAISVSRSSCILRSCASPPPAADFHSSSSSSSAEISSPFCSSSARAVSRSSWHVLRALCSRSSSD